MSENNHSTNKHELTTRGKVAALVAAVAVGAAAYKGVELVDHGVEAGATAVSNHNKTAALNKKIDNYYGGKHAANIAEHAKSRKDEPVESAFFIIRDKDVPITIAQDIARKGDFDKVVEQISAQEGSAGNLHAGDEVVLPLSEIDMDSVALTHPASYMTSFMNADGQLMHFKDDRPITYIEAASGS